MNLWNVVLSGAVVGGALWAVKRLIEVVVSLFSGDRDDDSQGLPRPYSRTYQERRALHDSSQSYSSYSGPNILPRCNPPPNGASSLSSPPHHQHGDAPTRARDHETRASASFQKIPAYNNPPRPPLVPTFVQPHAFLPICDRQSYDAARTEARRLQILKERHMTKKRKEAEQGNSCHADRYDKLIVHRAKTIDQLNAKASAWIYQENNRPGRIPADSVDLHNFRVVEAIEYAQAAIRDAKEQGKTELRLIVGKGKHSDGGVSRLRPAVAEDLKARGLDVRTGRKNTGVLVVWLGDVSTIT
ncbi:hypothetical protein PAXRUDRAFT_824619 [Paxillus rubicundulus Ve08.2h10]|uniref:Unplaced genomic scaffold scaffold_100, whole genome shotgun sequence n=1 Tax=Paxillus rubicundulus Ve08.2h10 TaxID=930991 RepID=A0A0D0EBJ9_9AGAM|nr:hypothetical protein PAXRUDRAFT_824619 [Paxillus rubicundulus Ve08.2h10]